jgi:hypothetical protein
MRAAMLANKPLKRMVGRRRPPTAERQAVRQFDRPNEAQAWTQKFWNDVECTQNDERWRKGNPQAAPTVSNGVVVDQAHALCRDEKGVGATQARAKGVGHA